MFVYRITICFISLFLQTVEETSNTHKKSKQNRRQETEQTNKQLVWTFSQFTKCITVILLVKLITILCFQNKYGEIKF